MGENFIAGIELGGTKTIALIAKGTQIIDEFRIPSIDPNDVLSQTANWIKEKQKIYDFKAIGIASFGPLCLDKNAPNYGFITKTPKKNWANTNVLGAYKSWFDGPIGFDTDVNGAGLAECLWGASIDCNSSIYITIGTGLGGGAIIDKKPIHGFMHPEMGHMHIKHVHQLEFEGNCPFHKDCIEGLVSGPAIMARYGMPAENIPNDDKVWDYIAYEIGEFLVNLIYILSPQKILIGGGVMQDKEYLFKKIRIEVYNKLNGYIDGLDLNALEQMIISPKLGDKAGPLGAIALGLLALEK